MGTYVGEALVDFESGPLPGDAEGGSLWIEKQKRFKCFERHQTDGALTLQEVGWWDTW